MERPNNVEELLRLGFRRFPEWDFKDPYTEAYILDKSKNTYRAHINYCNGPVHAKLGIVINKDKGTVDRWRDCVSNGSLERKILFNENQCSLSLNT